jgi:hypothetical protein
MAAGFFRPSSIVPVSSLCGIAVHSAGSTGVTHAWISVATERGMDTDVLPSLCGKLARSIADAESAYLTSCEDDIRESVRGAM